MQRGEDDLAISWPAKLGAALFRAMPLQAKAARSNFHFGGR